MWAASASVRFINDSKATNADAAERALVCFPRYFLDRGRQARRTGGIESLAPHFPRIRKAYLIGEAAEEFARTLDGRVPYEIVAARSTRPSRRAFADARSVAGTDARRAAVAGLRVVRPVPRFRSSAAMRSARS